MSITIVGDAARCRKEKLYHGKPIKIGKSSWMQRLSTHANLVEISEILHSTLPDAARFILDECSEIVLANLKLVSRRIAEDIELDEDIETTIRALIERERVDRAGALLLMLAQASLDLRMRDYQIIEVEEAADRRKRA